MRTRHWSVSQTNDKTQLLVNKGWDEYELANFGLSFFPHFDIELRKICPLPNPNASHLVQVVLRRDNAVEIPPVDCPMTAAGWLELSPSRNGTHVLTLRKLFTFPSN